MVLVASSSRHNGRPTGAGACVLSAPGPLPDSAASLANFPRWQSRFARSSGFIPQRDGRFAPPLKAKPKPAPDQDAIRSGPSAAGAA
jgi:hypothetical protein